MKHNWERKKSGEVNEWAWEYGFHHGVYCQDCGKKICVICWPLYMELDDCPGPKVDEQKEKFE